MRALVRSGGHGGAPAWAQAGRRRRYLTFLIQNQQGVSPDDHSGSPELTIELHAALFHFTGPDL